MDSLQTFFTGMEFGGHEDARCYIILITMYYRSILKYTKMMMKITRIVCFLNMANVTPHYFGEVRVTLAMAKDQFPLLAMIK